MKICFLSNVTSWHTIKWASWFSSRGHKVSVLSFDEPTPEVTAQLHGVDVYWLASKASASSGQLAKLQFLAKANEASRIIDRIDPDIVNAHYATSYGLLAALACKRPYILSVWGSDIYDFPNTSPIHKAALEYSLAKATHIFSTSCAMAEEIRKYTDKHIDITPFGVDMQLFRPSTEPRHVEGKYVVGTVKGLKKKYGIDTLVRAVAILHSVRPEIDLELRIAGKGPMAEELHGLASDLGIGSVVKWLGFISQEEAASEWRNFDAAVVASESVSESFGVSAVEAEASGTPLVITDIPGLMEACDGGRTVAVVRRKDPYMLAAALEELYDNPQKRAAMSAAERDYAMRAYEVNHCFKKIENLYHKYYEEGKAEDLTRARAFSRPQSDDAPTLGICILNYNGSSDTVECVSSFYENTTTSNIVCVLDNASSQEDYQRLIDGLRRVALPNLVPSTGVSGEKNKTHEDEEMLQEAKDCLVEIDVDDFNSLSTLDVPLLVVRSPLNTGFSRGNNILADRLISLGCEYILLLNNDTVVLGDAIDACVQLLDSNPKIGVATVNVCYYDEPDVSWSAGSQLLAAGHRKYMSDEYIANQLDRGNSAVPVKFVTGCFLMARSTVLREHGLLDDRFFFGEEDFNFALRMKRAGIRQVSLLDRKILHKVSRSIREQTNNSINSTVLHYTQRFIDMRLYYNSFEWNVWRRVYSVVIDELLRRRGVKTHRAIVRNVNMLAGEYDRVDENLFRQIMQGDYTE